MQATIWLSVVLVAGSLVPLACHDRRPPAARPNPTVSAPMSTAPSTATTEPANAEPVAPGEAAECVRDEDCHLMPRLDCCGNCGPAPPFEAVSEAELDAAKAAQDRCASEDHDCSRHTCEALPAGCSAHPACQQGVCHALITGACP